MLVVLAVQLGTGPFVEALHRTTFTAVAIALVVTALTTLCCAWRWRLVARALGLDVPLGRAVGACYRAEFLNSTLPGGVLGDVHRAVDGGRRTGEMSRAVRSVAWERSLGQVVQVAFTVAVLLALPSPIRPPAPVLVVVALVAVLGAVLLLRDRRAGARRLPGRVLLTAGQDLAAILRARRAWLAVGLVSVVVVLGHVVVFLVALRTAGADVPASTALPLALVVLLAGAIPTNIAGWGPREGAAAWAFGLAGLGAAQGVTVSVVYGVTALLATLPGAFVLVARRRPGRARTEEPAASPAAQEVACG